MNKMTLVIVILATAVVSSSATVGVIKYADKVASGGPIIILSDKRCKECNPSMIEAMLKRNFPNEKFEVIDWGTSKGKKLYNGEGIKLLPAVLLPKKLESAEGYKQISRFAEVGKKYMHLRTGGNFDPTAEICDNSIDDNGNGSIDCEDPSCKQEWQCMEKKDIPDVDVFVMSHCPYGTQIEKGLLPVWDLIGDKINLNIRFCDYAMHGEKEIKEQLKQFCIQKIDKKKYRKYLECFLKDGKEDNKCAAEAGISDSELQACIKKADGEFKVWASYNDKSKWQGRFPPFTVDAELADKYAVKGSPTLIINGVTASVGRSPKALLDAICHAFKEKPAECGEKLDDKTPAPGFGFEKGASASHDASCGT